ncbi:MAG: hypothetical protein E3J91_03225 [Hadesarchaea archaeon]|nr:MAG: hypothetical protein E3J91_03225 [Hadesarchaea archaeon]
MRAEKKMIALPALIMIMLSMTGVAVAHWSDSIQIEGTVHMASMTLAFDNYEPPICTEFHEVDGGLVPGELCGKNVGKTTCYYEGVITDPHTGKWGYENMIIMIDNAYPSYRVHCTTIVHNIGQIPVDICGFVVTDPTGVLTWDDNEGALVDKNGKPIINITHVDLVGDQIDPCQREKSEFDFHIKQDAQECHTYYFKIEIVYNQWGCTE